MSTSSPAALVFDWGDTLMTTFPESSGAMVDWPKVAAEPGAVDALAQLIRRYRLLVGTNAANSSAAQVQAALDRAGLGGYIERVFTVHELHSRKPEPGFYRALQQLTGLPTHQIVMVGDDFNVDISGAWQAGWRSVWYNPGAVAAPALFPLQDAEVTHLSALPAVLAAPSLPGVQQCTAWLIHQRASTGLLAHVQAVAALAYQMAVWLRASGQSVDPLLAHRGGLLHDLVKLAPPPPGPAADHGARAAVLLLEHQQPALAEIANRHLLHLILDANRAPRTWEEKLVYLADKLVEGSRPVTLEERLASLRRRYPANTGEIEASAPAIHHLQTELCAHLGLAPQELTPRLTNAVRGNSS